MLLLQAVEAVQQVAHRRWHGPPTHHCRCLMLGALLLLVRKTHVCPQFVSCGCRSMGKADIQQMLHDVASGLHHLHGANLVPCDLKPNNVSVLPGRARTCSCPCTCCLHCTVAYHSAALGLWTSWATARHHLPLCR